MIAQSPRVAIHTSRVHKPPTPSILTTPHLSPDDAQHAIHNDTSSVDPRRRIEEITKQAAENGDETAVAGAHPSCSAEPLPCLLCFVPVDGFVAIGLVEVAEDVQGGADAPGFGEEVWAAGGENGGEIEVALRRGMGDENVGFGWYSAGPGVVVGRVGEGVLWTEWDDCGNLRSAVES